MTRVSKSKAYPKRYYISWLVETKNPVTGTHKDKNGNDWITFPQEFKTRKQAAARMLYLQGREPKKTFKIVSKPVDGTKIP